MQAFKPSIRALFLFFILMSGIFIFPVNGWSNNAKDLYLQADDCYKKLRNSESLKKKETEWLNCISKYEAIQRQHPESSWAPAGMYKAAQLNLNLARISGKITHQERAANLLVSLRHKYPQSAYSGNAQTLLKSITSSTPIPVEEPPPPPSDDSPKFNPKVSKKEETKNGNLVQKAVEEKEKPENKKPIRRLYVDVEQTRLGRGIAEHTPINDNLLIQARAGQYLPHTVRVVVDIKSFENYKVFSLKDPFRIVIDVWGKGSNGSPPISSSPVIADSEKSEPKKKSTGLTTDNLQSSNITRQFALGVRKIVIDPGHGGSDPGAPGYYPNQWEKDHVLKMAKRLAAILKDRLNCTVLLTRTEDKKLTLEERTAIANTQRADLFISLHCNAAKNKNLKGIETYFLNLATDSQAIAVAARENATSEKNISDLDYILSD